MTPLRVVLAEDSFLVREGLRRLLADGEEIEVVGEAVDATTLRSLTAALKPDAVLTDIRMPPGMGIDGIDAALDLRRGQPGLGVVVLSHHADAVYVQALFRDGTAGLAYLLKERVADRNELVRALVAVTTGGSVVDAKLLDVLLGARRAGDASPLKGLSERERDVLREMAAGHTNTAIAGHLFVSESAVSKHITQIFEKLGLAEQRFVDRRVRAVLTFLAAQHGPGDPLSPTRPFRLNHHAPSVPNASAHSSPFSSESATGARSIGAPRNWR